MDRDALPASPACERNKGPILEELRGAFAGVRRVLEVGSGTGQHAVHFAAGLPHLEWQPTELPDAVWMVRERRQIEGPPNLLEPLGLDVRITPWPVAPVDGVFTANTLHIMDWAGVVAFFAGVGGVLLPGGRLCIYGPFRYGGRHTSESNERFDLELRARDPASGLRDQERIVELATAQGLTLLADHGLPANNRLLSFARAG
jgi:SAM-dependent methyltransferase